MTGYLFCGLYLILRRFQAICSNAFTILHAMDELVAWGGHRELVSSVQIHEYINMISAEERFQNLLRDTKEAEETERRQRRAIAIDKEKLKKLELEKALSASSRKVPASTVMIASSVSLSTPSHMPKSSDMESQIGAPKKGLTLGKKHFVVN